MVRALGGDCFCSTRHHTGSEIPSIAWRARTLLALLRMPCIRISGTARRTHCTCALRREAINREAFSTERARYQSVAFGLRQSSKGTQKSSFDDFNTTHYNTCCCSCCSCCSKGEDDGRQPVTLREDSTFNPRRSVAQACLGYVEK